MMTTCVCGKRGKGAVAAKKKVRGFAKNAAAIAKKQGVSLKRAQAILAAATRRASPAAKRKNPRLRKVK